VFLDEQGLCKIHAKFGEEAKPFPCRIYPFAFHAGGNSLTIGLRFSCPSVVANRGEPVRAQTKEIKKLADAVVPDRAKKVPPPKISPKNKVDWRDFHRFIDALDATIAADDAPLLRKLLRALFWVELVEKSTFQSVRGARLTEFLSIISEAADAEIPNSLQDDAEPSRLGRVLFRMLVAQYARKDTMIDLESGLRGRWKLFRSAIRFARGRGDIPPLQNAFQQVPFATVEQPFGELTAEAEELLTRYFRVKIQGIHFCGRAYYGLDLVEGFRSLVLVFPSVLWLARWLAGGDGRTTLETEDVAQALSIADHYHAYAPSFGGRNFRRRVRILTQSGDLSKLCVWYTR